MSLKKPCQENFFLHGFTLIELLVSVSVMSIIAGMSLSGGPQGIIRYSLSDNTYRTEILLREAQVQGSAVNSVNSTYAGAGMFFDRASSSQVLKFKDRVIPDETRDISIGDGLYLSTSDETTSINRLTNRNTISKLCVATSTNPLTCNYDNPAIAIDTLTVSFIRPKQSAHIFINGTTSIDFTTACIQIDSLKAPAQGFVKSIKVYKSGLIVKKTGTCI